MPCDFSRFAPRLYGDVSDAASAATTPPRKGRGRPRANWSSWAEQIRLSSVEAYPSGSSDLCGSCGAAAAAVPRPSALNVEDIELFHHYMVSAGTTIDGRWVFWCDKAPRLGLQYSCVYHIILAFAAYHLGRLKPVNEKRYLDLGEKHTTAAIRKATELLPCLNRESSPALYITAVLVCLTSFAKGPTSGQLLVVAEDGQVSWLSLFRGVRLVIETMGWSTIFSGPLADVAPGSEAMDGDASYPIEATAMKSGTEWETSLAEVASLVSLLSEPEKKAIYECEIERLSRSFAQTFGTKQSPQPHVQGKFQCIMSWMYEHNDDTANLVRNRDSIALLLLGHFCVLLRTLENHWFMEGWAAHLMEEICHSSEACIRWLEWPLEYLNMEHLQTRSTTPHAKSERSTTSD